MFYVSSINKNMIGVTDNDDGVTEDYTVHQLEKICKDISIEGFESKDNIYIVEKLSSVVRYFQYGDYGKGLKRMGLYGLELYFTSKPRSNGDGTSFVDNRVIRVYRNTGNKYSYYDENRNYKSGYSFEEMCDILNWYYSYRVLKLVKIL